MLVFGYDVFDVGVSVLIRHIYQVGLFFSIAVIIFKKKEVEFFLFDLQLQMKFKISNCVLRAGYGAD